MAAFLPLPKGLLFDLGGTILREVDYQPMLGIAQLFGKCRLRPGIDRDGAQASSIALLSEIRANRDSEITEFPFQAWLRLIIDQFCVDHDFSLADAELEFWRESARMEPQPGVAAVLNWLAERNIPAGIVSNAMFSARVLEWELSRHGFGDAFQFVMSSADYGFQKPHPAIFNAAAGRFGLHPREVWFVGDDYHNDVKGARGSGMNVIWYNPSQARAADDCTTSSISDWEDFLESVASSPESPDRTQWRDQGS